jgi:hypothetical protein
MSEEKKDSMFNSRTTFPEWYNECIEEYERKSGVSESLLEELRKKRDFGLEKYGDQSFQSSFENTINVSIKEHAREEVIDLLNYLFHMKIIKRINGKTKKDSALDVSISQALEILDLLQEIKL